MEEKDIKPQFHLLQKEVETAGARLEDTRLNLIAALDALKLEIEILKRFAVGLHSVLLTYNPAEPARSTWIPVKGGAAGAAHLYQGLDGAVIAMKR
jgi:hypothetical protein